MCFVYIATSQIVLLAKYEQLLASSRNVDLDIDIHRDSIKALMRI